MSENPKSDKARLETIAAAHGIARDRNFRAVTPPIYLSSTFAFSGYEQGGAYDYTRTAPVTAAELDTCPTTPNPTRQAVRPPPRLMGFPATAIFVRSPRRSISPAPSPFPAMSRAVPMTTRGPPIRPATFWRKPWQC